MAVTSESTKSKKLTKAQKRKLLSERGKKGAEKRGIGVGSRTEFELPAKWKKTNCSYGNREFLKIESPGKTVYHSVNKVKETLKKRKMEFCLTPESSTESSVEEISEFEDQSESVQQKNVERQLFVCETTAVTDFVEQVNRTSHCSTPSCNGECTNYKMPFNVFWIKRQHCVFSFTSICKSLWSMCDLFRLNMVQYFSFCCN